MTPSLEFEVPPPARGCVALLVGTRKGAFLLRSDAARATWDIDGPHFLGHIVHHLVLDPRDGRTLLLAARTGHLGPTLFRSTDFGGSWNEVAAPPAFPNARARTYGATSTHIQVGISQIYRPAPTITKNST